MASDQRDPMRTGRRGEAQDHRRRLRLLRPDDAQSFTKLRYDGRPPASSEDDPVSPMMPRWICILDCSSSVKLSRPPKMSSIMRETEWLHEKIIPAPYLEAMMPGHLSSSYQTRPAHFRVTGNVLNPCRLDIASSTGDGRWRICARGESTSHARATSSRCDG